MTQPVKAGQRLDVLANKRDELREQKRDLEAQLKKVKEALDSNEFEIIEALDELGVNRFAVGKLSFSISESQVGNVEDWDQLYGFIRENDAFHLLQRRLSNSAYNELVDLGEAPPGVVPFTKRGLNFSKRA